MATNIDPPLSQGSVILNPEIQTPPPSKEAYQINPELSGKEQKKESPSLINLSPFNTAPQENGILNNRAKLSVDNVIYILKHKEQKQKELAAQFGVSQTCVSKIRTEKRWANGGLF